MFFLCAVGLLNMETWLSEHIKYNTVGKLEIRTAKAIAREILPSHEMDCDEGDLNNAAILLAIIDHESDFNANAVGGKGEIGLMQVHPVHGKPKGQLNALKAGKKLFGLAVEKSRKQGRNTLAEALAIYNGGWKNRNTKAAKKYAWAVLDKYDEYQEQIYEACQEEYYTEFCKQNPGDCNED